MVMWPEDAARLRDYERLAAENAKLRAGGPDLERYREAWLREIERLRPEIMRDPVADAVRKMAEQVFDAYAASLARLKLEGTPGVMHEVDRSFYNLVIQERDLARVQVENRNQQMGELRAAVQQLKAQLDEVQHRRVLLCPSAHIPEAMATSMGEEDGTMIRASDDPTLEWVLKEGAWVPTG